MKRTFLAASLVLLAAPAFAGSVRGEYVEARTAEVFAGGCVMSSQAETMGKTAVLAWHVTRGVYDGQTLERKASLLLPSRVRVARFNADGSRLLLVTADQTARLIDTAALLNADTAAK